MNKIKPTLTDKERDFILNNKPLRDAVASEDGSTENTVWQWAKYKPHIFAKKKTAMKILKKYMAKSAEQEA